jgi:transposase
MPRPSPVPIRQAMFRLWQQGQATRQIATSLGLPSSTVRRFLQRFRRRGIDGIPPDYHHLAASETVPSELMQTAVRMRQEHPTWGAGLIRVQLLLEAPGRSVPSERTLQRWFVRADLSPAPVGRHPRANLTRATDPHETWQMDAKEHIRIQNNEEVSWLRMIDECSGAVLWTAVFPPRDLGACLARGRAGADPPGFCSLGVARPLPSRQRLSLGVAGRLLDRAVAVADRPRYRDALEQRGEPARERGRRAFPRDIRPMVRAVDVSDARGIADPLGANGPPVSRGLSLPETSHSTRGLPGLGAFRSAL